MPLPIVLTAKRFGRAGHQINRGVVISRLCVQSEPRAVLVHAVETAALLKLVPGGTRDGQERAIGVDALHEILVAANMIAAQKSFYTWNEISLVYIGTITGCLRIRGITGRG